MLKFNQFDGGSSALKRFKEDFGFRLLVLVVAGAFVVSGLMAWLRFAEGNQVQMWVDIALATVLFASFLAMLGGVRPEYVARTAAILSNVGILISAWVDPASGTHWVFVVFAVMFLLFGHFTALLLTVVTLLCVAARLFILESTVDFMGFMAAGALVIGFNFVFAFREERHRKQLEAIAMQDSLTGIGNRRAFSWRVEALMDEARRHGTALGMFMLDLDHFKQINDRYGHAEGDRVLTDFARIIHHNSRSIDELFRLGGEEFALLLPGMDAVHMAAHAERLLDLFRQELKAEDQCVTASIGATAWQPEEQIKVWMARTDQALYEAKEGGRDRVVVH